MMSVRMRPFYLVRSSSKVRSVSSSVTVVTCFSAALEIAERCLCFHLCKRSYVLRFLAFAFLAFAFLAIGSWTQPA